METRGYSCFRDLFVPGLRFLCRHLRSIPALHAGDSRGRYHPSSPYRCPSMGACLRKTCVRPFMAAIVGVGRDTLGNHATASIFAVRGRWEAWFGAM